MERPWLPSKIHRFLDGLTGEIQPDVCRRMVDPHPTPDLSTFPAPIVSAIPVLSWEEFCGGSDQTIRSMLDVGETRLTTSGRMAIALALRLMEVGPGNEVLVPAYHCSSMLEPLWHEGIRCTYYRINPDTSIDLNDVERRLTPRTRALMVTHYFGFPQDMMAIRNFCDTHGLMLLEDCAHAFFGEYQGKPLGSYGDYAIGSLMKFFPVYDGGCLVSARHSLKDVDLASCPITFQVRAMTNALERAFRQQRLWPLNYISRPFLFAKDRLWRRYRTHPGNSRAPNSIPAASEGGFGYSAEWVRKKISPVSSLLFRLSSTKQNVICRRRNYARIAKAFSQIQGCTVLHPLLPDHVVPYVVPVLFANPDPLFWELRRKAVPVQRWEFLSKEVTPTEYPVSASYSRRLIQVPCHQSLRPDELSWITEMCAATFGRTED